jgi:hypothetical protein
MLTMSVSRGGAGQTAKQVYFLGWRSEKPLAPHDMIAYHPGPR